ncbi:MAG: hypothetical protein K8H89_16440 [Flavobacteriales bacterium]|jgi:hypothetical protein|nr:hypothetical protein [Flavobacteriales bacterium]MCB0759264.1 hypothetical protein [Flavobacteriales bacterium]
MQNLRIEAQPDDDTCGATALHAVYRHFGEKDPLQQVINEVHHMEEGGTLAVLLGIHALLRGYHVRLYSYNLAVFDPSWDGLSPEALRRKLIAQTRIKDGKKLHAASLAYARFLKEGGDIRFDDPSPALLNTYFNANLPILAGLSATYLYKSKREYADSKGRSVYHDLRGKPMGHFVVLRGMEKKHVFVADPYHDNPMAEGRTYEVPVGRLINSIMLGIVTYDANLLVLSPTPFTE